jgi:hypothetical protein
VKGVEIRYRPQPDAPEERAVIRSDDPFEVCNRVRERLFPDVPLPEKDEKFDAITAARHGKAPAAAIEAPRPGVRDTSMLAYRSLEWSGRMTRQQRMVMDLLAANAQRDYTRQEIANALQLGINVVCGRVNELMRPPFELLLECGRRKCRITGESANALQIRRVERQAA